VVAVNDIVSFGDDRGPRVRRWRRLAVAATCVTLALAAALAWYLPGSRDHGRQAGPAALSPSPVVRSIQSPPPPLPTRPAQLTGLPLPRGSSLRLLVGGQRPAWLQVASGRTEPIRGLPGSDAGYQFIRIAGGWAVQPFPPDAVCDNCAPGPLPVYYLADGSTAARRIGTADVIAPAAAPGALWLIGYPRGVDMSTAAGTAQEVRVTGAALGLRVQLPAGYAIDRGTRAGLLLVQEQPGSAAVRYELWDPGAQRVTRSFVNVIAASTTQIAWQPACTDDCQVHVLTLPDGGTKEIALPPRSTSGAGAFSPDGQLLALLVSVTADGHVATSNLMVATVASGRIAAVPGTTVGGGIAVEFGWQPGSRQLIAGVSTDTQGQAEWQFGLWQPGAARLSIARARMPDQSWPVIDLGPY
jgi:hypothetical protein